MKRSSAERPVERVEPGTVRRRKPMRLRAAESVGKGTDFDRVLWVANIVAGAARLRALVTLSFGPMNASQLATAARAGRDISCELRTMKCLGLLDSHREGPFVVYSLTDRGRKILTALVECAAA
jgi:DNA-binding HxlR family transcriptional regulator